MFLTEGGDLLGCGMNDLGQLGIDNEKEELRQLESMKNNTKRRQAKLISDVLVPTDVDCFQGIPVVNVACGENHALAVSVMRPNIERLRKKREIWFGLGACSSTVN